MAQVKKINKFANGGTLTVDGEVYTMDEVQTALSQMAPEDRLMMAGLSKALASGNNWTASKYDNSFSGDGVDNWVSSFYGGSVDKANRKLSKTGNVPTTMNATFNTNTHKLRRAATDFFTLLHHASEDVSADTINSLELDRGSKWWNYDVDESGAKTYRQDPFNSGQMRTFDNIVKHILSNADTRAAIKHSNWSDQDYNNAIHWVEDHADASQILNSIKNKILSGEDLNATEESILNTFGFSKSELSDEEKDTDRNKKSRKDFISKYGIPETDFDKYFAFDESGNLVALQSFYDDLGSDISKDNNYWFNQGFRNNKGWDANTLPWLNNLWLMKGKVYTSDSEDLKKMLRVNGFYNNNKRGVYNNDKVQWIWDKSANMPLNGAGLYDSVLGHPNIRYYSQVANLASDPNSQYVQYIDLNEDPDILTGIHNPKYGFVNDDGSITPIEHGEQDQLTWAVDELGNPIAHEFYNRTSMLSDNDYYNYYTIPKLTTRNNTPFTAYVSGETGNVALAIDNSKLPTEGINYKNGTNAVVIPKEIWPLLNKKEVWEALENDSLREKFYDFLVKVSTGDLDVVQPNRWIKLLEKLGIINGDSKESVVEIIKEWAKNSAKTASLVKVPTVQSNKLGGWLPYMQAGGVFGKNANTKIESVDYDYEDGTLSKDLLNSDDHWTSADKADMAAVILDLASTAATFIPEYGNIVGAIGGAGADFTQFYANTKRDGMDRGDWKALAAGLGLDALTLIPVFGTEERVAKLIPKIQRVARPLSLLFAGWGAYEASDAINHIASTGEFTVEDARKIAIAIQAGIGAGSAWKSAKNQAKLANDINAALRNETKVPVKIGSKTFAQPSEEVLIKAASAKNVDEAANIIKAELKKTGRAVDDDFKDIASADLLAKFGIGAEGKYGIGAFRWGKQRPTAIAGTEPVRAIDLMNPGKGWGNPKMKGADGSTVRVEEFINTHLADPKIRAKLAGAYNVEPGKASTSAQRYYASRLAGLGTEFNDVEVVGKTGWRYKGHWSEAVEKPKDMLLLPAPETSAAPAATSVVNAPVVTPTPAPAPVAVTPTTTAMVPVSGSVELPPIERFFRNPRRFVLPGRKLLTAGKPTVSETGMTVSNTPRSKATPTESFGGVRKRNSLQFLQNQLENNPQMKEFLNANPEMARKWVAELRSQFTSNKTRNWSSAEVNDYFNRMINKLKVKYGLRFKKGGVLVAQGGVSLPSWRKEEIEKSMFAPISTFNNTWSIPKINVEQIPQWTPQKPGVLSKDYLEKYFNISYTPYHSFVANVNTSEGTKRDLERSEGTNGSSATFNLPGNPILYNAANAYDRVRMVEGLLGNSLQTKQEQLANDALLESIPSGYQINANRTPSNSELYNAKTAAASLRQLVPSTSDSKVNAGMNQKSAEEYSRMLQTGLDATSSRIDKTNEDQINADNRQAEIDSTIDNKSREITATHDANSHNISANGIRRAFINNILPNEAQRAQALRDDQNRIKYLAEQFRINQKSANANSYLRNLLLSDTAKKNLWKKTAEYESGMNTEVDYMNWYKMNYPTIYRDHELTTRSRFGIDKAELDAAIEGSLYPAARYSVNQDWIKK